MCWLFSLCVCVCVLFLFFSYKVREEIEKTAGTEPSAAPNPSERRQTTSRPLAQWLTRRLGRVVVGVDGSSSPYCAAALVTRRSLLAVWRGEKHGRVVVRVAVDGDGWAVSFFTTPSSHSGWRCLCLCAVNHSGYEWRRRRNKGLMHVFECRDTPSDAYRL